MPDFSKLVKGDNHMTNFSKIFDGQVADTTLDFLEMFADEEEAVLGFPSILYF